MTTSGVAIGRKITRLDVDRPRKEWRTSANAISVPSTVARSVAVRLTPMLSRSDSQRPSGSQIVVQLLQVKASNSAVADRAGRLVERQRDDVADRDERVDQHQDPDDQHDVVGEPAARERRGAAGGPRPGHGSWRPGGRWRSQQVLGAGTPDVDARPSARRSPSGSATGSRPAGSCAR